MERIQSNKLIAQFMGYVDYDNSDSRYKPGEWYTGSDVIYARYSDCEYDKSWDWFMPAYHKFRKMQGLPNDGYLRHCNDIEQWICRVNLPEAFRRLSDAILWYNSIKK